MPEHFDDEALTRYAAGRAGADHDSIARHLALCDACRERLGAIIESALRDPGTWKLAGAPADEESYDLLAERIAQEDEEARRMLQPLLDGETPAYRLIWNNLTKKKRFRTGGVARLLAKLAHDALRRAPREAVHLADEAIAIAGSLPDDYYPADIVYELRGDAWKERANACRYLGDLRPALDALQHAERAYRHLLAPEPWLAVVDQIRATVLRISEKYDQALVCAMRAASEFARMGDMKRYVDARIVEANIRCEAGDPRAARDILRPIYESLNDDAELETKATIANNLGHYSMEIGDIGEATRCFLLALQAWESLDAPAQGTLTRRNIGYLALVAGNAPEALRRLTVALESAERLGLRKDAELMRLDIAEAHLAMNQYDEAALICRSSVALFTAAGMSIAARTAASYLQEAAKHRTLSVAKIRHVKHFLRRLDEQPQLVFALPE
jgi:tetratricopeptide (TPR) repeat protein